MPFTLVAVGQCTVRGSAYFTVINSGAAMTQPQPYQITDANGNTLVTGQIQLPAGGSTLIPASDRSGQVTLLSGTVSVSVRTDCAETISVPPSAIVSPTAVGVCGEANVTGSNGFPTINLTSCTPDTRVVQRPVWASIPIGGATCPDWLVYHTNMTGDWELFRLGDLPDKVQADPNLSRGVGPRVFDIMPTLSPDRKWVAFTSNRDGNWEIYLSAVEENSIRRVTYNTTAIDLDPVWSPNGDQIIYESNRDGNWDLYRFNVDTGEEARLTTDASNNVNAAWSNDASRIAFESDRDGFWQIYELNLSTLETRRLSDGSGDDHEPQYSNDGQRIVFRSYRDGDNSTLYTMDVNGGEVTRISDPVGNALNAAISPDSRFIAYQSTLNGVNSIYVYELASGVTRTLTDTASESYAPTWWCGSDVVVFTSDVTGDPNLFDAPVLPIQAKPIAVKQAARQLTFDTADDQYPESAPPEENASRQQQFPSPVKNK
jgi:Tol biopolymer transport system component